MNHELYMQEAIALAINNVKNKTGGPFGCIIVKDNTIIARACNQVTQTCDPTAHAEIVAIRQACKSLKSFQLDACILYTSCEPCPMCMGAIFWARPAAVYYAATKEDAARINFDDSFIYDQLNLSPEERKITCTNIMRKEAKEVFRLWEKAESKIEY